MMMRTICSSTRGITFRSCAVLGFCGAIAMLRMVEPARMAWLPFHTSCGAFTGLPCLFCGTTRAIYHLLNGNFSAALYYNWLAFPIIAGVLGFIVLLLLELVTGKRIPVFGKPLQLTPRMLVYGIALLLSLWSLQVYLAISQHKSELLNPAGSLYSLLVRQ